MKYLFGFTLLLCAHFFAPISAWAAVTPGVTSAIVVGSNPATVAVNPITNKAYILENAAGGSVVQSIDLATDALTTIPLAHPGFALAINSVTNEIYVTCAGEIDVLSGATDTFLTKAASGTSNQSLLVNPVTNTIYSADRAAGTVTVINGSAHAVTTTLASNLPGPVGMALNPVTNKVYVFNNDAAGTLSTIDGATNATTTVALGAGANLSAIGVNPVTNIVFALAAGNGSSAGSVIMVNGLTGSVTGSLPVGVAPAALAVDPQSNQVYVSNGADNTVTILYASGGSALTQAQTVAVGNQPQALAFNPSLQQAYVVNTADQTVAVLDTAGRQVIETVAVGAGAAAIAVDPLTNQVLTANSASATISVINPALAQSALSLGVSGALISAAVNPITNQIYISKYDASAGAGLAGSVLDIDGASGSTTTIVTGPYASAMAVNPMTNKIYLANDLSLGQPTGITVIDGATNAANLIAAPVLPDPASTAAIAVNVVTNQIYIANGHASTVTAIDGATNTVTTIAAGLDPYAVAVNSVTNTIYVANAGDDTVTVIDGATNATSSLPVGATPVAVSVNPTADQIYVANQNSAAVTFIDGVTNEAFSIEVGNSPQALAFNPLTNRLYVGNAADHSVSVINVVTEAVAVVNLPIILSTPGPVTASSMSLAVDPANNTVYAADTSAGCLVAIDGASNAMTNLSSSVSLNTASSGVIVNPVTHGVYSGTVTAGLEGVTVLGPTTPGSSSAETLTTAITPLPNNQLTSGAANIALSAASSYTPTTPAVRQLYYQLDSASGAWTPASGAGASAVAPLANVLPGLHTVYAFASDGQETPPDGYRGNNLIPGAVSAYTFLSTPGAFSFNEVTVTAYVSDIAVTLQVQRNFTAPAAISYQTIDDTAIAGANYVPTQGVLSFAAGQTQASINIPILNQSGNAAFASFLVQLSNPTGDNIVASPSIARVFIVNDSGGDFSDSAISMASATPPNAAPAATGSVTVTLTYDTGSGAGQWRLFGEPQWRASEATATGLTAGNYEVEFMPIASYQAPALQVISVAAAQAAAVSAEYISGAAANGSLNVTLVPNTGGWRVQGAGSWNPSGSVLPNLPAGSYILEFAPIANDVTPPDREAFVEAGQTTSLTCAYVAPFFNNMTGGAPQLQDPGSAPYLFAGQIQTDSGTGTGFVPLDRIVVTAADVVFDPITLGYATGVRWYFQQELGTAEEPPQIPTGVYLLDGYASQRTLDNTPASTSAAAQQLDVAVLYFLAPTARFGQSGYLASNYGSDSWLTLSAQKLIVGYPAAGVDPSTFGQLYATPATTASLVNIAGGSLFTTTALSGGPGVLGGPLCVQQAGVYYPAAIYLGGASQTVVRAIDSEVINLMNLGEVSGNGGANHVGGGVILASIGLSGTTAFVLGGIAVNIEPADAVASGAVWKLSGENVTRPSGSTAAGLAAGNYVVTFPAAVSGYATPANMSASVEAGGTANLTAIYTPSRPPTITSSLSVTAAPAKMFTYQITAALEPISFNATGLPAGLTIAKSTGLISGVPTSSGVSTVTLSATNAKGTGMATMTLTVPIPGKLDVTTVGSGTVPKSYAGATLQSVGSAILIKATPATGYIFSNWTDLVAGQVVSTQPTYGFTMPLILDLQATFAPSPFVSAAGTFTGLIQGASLAESGFAKITLTSAGSFSAAFTIGQQMRTISNSFNNQGQFFNQFSLPDGRVFQAAITLSGGVISGTLTDTSNSSLVHFTATKPVSAPIPSAISALAGTYSAALAPTTAPPTGDGVATITVTATGAIKISGTLGDGAAISGSGTLDANGSFPFYFSKAAAAKSGAEIALGQITAVPEASPAQFTATLNWFRNANALDPAYPAGFDTRISLTADPSQPLNLLQPQAHITFAGGDLTNPIVQILNISTAGLVTPASITDGAFTMKYTASTGLFSGSFIDLGNKTRTFTGALLQSQNEGFGYFQETSGITGSVLLQSGP